MDHRYRAQIDRLNHKLNNLSNQLEVIEESLLQTKPKPEKWSIVKILQHLVIAESQSIRYISKKTLDISKLEPVTIKSKWRELKLRSYLRLPFPVPAPKGVQPPEDMNLSYQETIEKYRETRKKAEELLTSLEPVVWTMQIQKHPLVGRISLQGTLDFFELHFDRHKKQIDEILKQSVF